MLIPQVKVPFQELPSESGHQSSSKASHLHFHLMQYLLGLSYLALRSKIKKTLPNIILYLVAFLIMQPGKLILSMVKHGFICFFRMSSNSFQENSTIGQTRHCQRARVTSYTSKILAEIPTLIMLSKYMILN